MALMIRKPWIPVICVVAAATIFLGAHFGAPLFRARSQATGQPAGPDPTLEQDIGDAARLVVATEANSLLPEGRDDSLTSKNASLRAILSATPVKSVADVAATLRAIDTALPDTDGLKWFNHLYIRTTNGTIELTAQGEFADPQWIAELDVVFANLYFEAASAALNGRAMALAWKPLFDSRFVPGIARIQFALAGMNAHINRDLSVALFQTAQQDGSFPSQSSARFKDFRRFNRLLKDVEAKVKEEFRSGPVKDFDDAARGLDDILAMWSVAQARDAAWMNGENLWHLQNAPILSREFLHTLDTTTGITGQGLLVPNPILTGPDSRR